MLPANYRKMLFSWVSYLSMTERLSFTVRGTSNGVPVEFDMPYLHRWKPQYRKRMLAKFYLLEDYLNDKFGGVVPCTMITFTIQQKLDYSDYDYCWNTLRDSFIKFRKVLRERYGQNDYFKVLESHKTGYPHIHMAYFYDIPESDFGELQRLWAMKYGNSLFPDIALKFSIASEYESGTNLKSVKNYLMKYLVKSFVGNNLSYKEKLFHSYLWANKIRGWTCSHNLSLVMAKSAPDSDFVAESIIMRDSENDAEYTLQLGKRTNRISAYKAVVDEIFVAEIVFEGLVERHKKSYKVELIDYGDFKKWRLTRVIRRLVLA